MSRRDAALARRFQRSLSASRAWRTPSRSWRGLKEKYELHHGVRITDSALVGGGDAVASLHHRPLPARQAIDLVDEAAARLKMQVDSKPEELDNLDRESCG